LQEPGALEVAAVSGVPICLMHMQGQPRTMQANPQYQNLLTDVGEFLQTFGQPRTDIWFVIDNQNVEFTAHCVRGLSLNRGLAAR
ncbi:MAG: dihydropteroate synthase, partial [Poseidonia sp.]